MASISETRKWKYDVFLSFRGEDTRNNFVSHLYTFLKFKGIHAFKDDKELDRGKSISPELSEAIEQSRIAVIIFSKNYASSIWCLEELVKIMECVQKKGQIPIPVFYDVDPSDVRNQKISFGEAFAKHEAHLKGTDLEKVKIWRKVVTQAAKISGWDVRNTANGNESECIELMVNHIFNSLDRSLSAVTMNLVGVESHLAEVKSLLNVGFGGVCSVGIWGMGGIGKTTIAREIFDALSGQFDGSCFLANIREVSKKHGLEYLQKTLLSHILKLNSLNIGSVYEGINMIKARLHSKKVLIVLDDVDNGDQVENLIGNGNCLGSGSRIITTTRDRHLLNRHNHLYEVHLLSDSEALQLFSWHAFQTVSPEKEFEELTFHVLHYAKGLPLALKVLGAFLYGRDMVEWISALDRLKDTAEEEIVKQLRISLDGLGPKEKNLFLDIACFFRGKKEDEVIRILDGCRFHSKIGISVLAQKSLLYVSRGVIEMHDLIQEMGRQVVRQVYPDIPGRYSRLWRYEDVCDVFTENTGTEAIDGIMVPFELESLICNRSKAFRKMNCLRILIVKGDEIRYHDPIAHAIDCLPNSLQWLDWSYYHFESLPESFQPRKLVGLNMVSSSIVELWKGLKVFDSLTTINLSWSKNLQRTPDLSGTPNLQRLVLKQCVSLEEVHSSTAYLRKLTLLNLENCKSLEFLPSSIQTESLESFNLSGCLKLKEVPELSENMYSLLNLRLACTAIQELSSSIGHLSAVSILDLSFCEELVGLPANVCQLRELKVLILTGCSRLKTLPGKMGNLVKLEELYVDDTAILQLPDSILHLNKLTVLSVKKGRKTKCPFGLKLKFSQEYCLWPLKKLDLSGCNLLDKDVSHLNMFPSLSELNLSRNKFVSLKHICLPWQLQYLNLTYCEELKELPGLPPGLRELYADDFLAQDCFSMLLYSKLYLISFTNSSYEQLYSDKGNNSSLMNENCQQKIIHNTLVKIFCTFFNRNQVSLSLSLSLSF
ncbi:TMV resistance protein N-like isoform X1 [Lycium ferocissimum]|uniref:TMV resistance protein N-like isoform X1 n=1 Tax=Lycium ferocissimum TaxID=112874 RepID=UPI0028168892|nr:TMV resistance protein N-like isoform X1 [Lycium ferocissimum]